MKVKNAIQVALIIPTLFLMGCETMSISSTRTIELDGKSYSEEELGPFESWVCRDHVYGGKILVEVGRFNDPNLSNIGFVLYDGTSTGELTSYQRKGTNLRWDWGPDGNNFAFVLKPDGIGHYFDFTKSSDGSAESDGIYRCKRR